MARVAESDCAPTVQRIVERFQCRVIPVGICGLLLDSMVVQVAGHRGCGSRIREVQWNWARQHGVLGADPIHDGQRHFRFPLNKEPIPMVGCNE